MRFVFAAKVRDVPARGGKFVRIEEEEIALFNVEGKFYAISNVCPHQHISALHQGELDGLFVTCPMHGWTYSLETGEARNAGGKVTTYPIRIAGERILVGIEDGEK